MSEELKMEDEKSDIKVEEKTEEKEKKKRFTVWGDPCCLIEF